MHPAQLGTGPFENLSVEGVLVISVSRIKCALFKLRKPQGNFYMMGKV